MQQIGRYQVLEEIARGGMGVVFRALDPVSKRKVAIKVLLYPDPDPRFLQEVRSLARLQHPGIVAFYDMAQDHAGRDFVVMELVEGESLKERLQRDGPLPLGDALDLTHQLAKAIDYAHQRGVLHRDLKPHNVLVTHGGQVKLTDFGLGKVVNQTGEVSRPSLTRSGEIMGTPAYMPPEQAAGDKHGVGPASDVYSLGATLYALLTGRPPFKADTTINLIHAVLEKQPEPPSKHRPEVPPEIDALVLRCLAKAPGDRYSSASEVIAALAGRATPAAADIVVPAFATRAPSRNRSPLRVGAGLVILGLTVALVVAAAAKGARDATHDGLPAASSPAPATTTGEAPLPLAPETDTRALAEAAFAKGKQAFGLRRYEAARDALTEAIRLDPNYAEAYTHRGAARGRLGDFQGAIEDCTEAIRLDPDDEEAYRLRGAARGRLGDFQAAIEDCTEAIRLDPDYAETYTLRGVARARLGDFRAVIEDCTEAIRLDPDDAVAYRNRGAAHVRLGDSQGAIEDCTEAIRLDPNYAEAYFNRGAARGSLGDYQSAIEDFEHALELKPDAIWAAQARLYLSEARKDLAEQQGE